jgi:mRNA interferase HicA
MNRVKRVDLIRQITALGAVFFEEGGEHTKYRNPRTGVILAIPRHREISPGVARKILKLAAAS